MFRKEDGAIDMVSLIPEKNFGLNTISSRNLTVVIAAVTMMVGLESKKYPIQGAYSSYLSTGNRRCQHGKQHAINQYIGAEYLAHERSDQHGNCISRLKMKSDLKTKSKLGFVWCIISSRWDCSSLQRSLSSVSLPVFLGRKVNFLEPTGPNSIAC